MEATDYVILFKTNDEVKTIERKYQRLLIHFEKLSKQKDGSHLKIKMI
jgi:hypothetical protein